MVKAEQLSASMEGYLEAIFWIIVDKGAARTRDIAKRLGVKAGSVTGALHSLSEREFIDYTPYEVITLTSAGFEEAKRIIRKHEILEDFFTQILRAKPDMAEENACKIEHIISDELADQIALFTEFIQSCPRCGGNWIKQFHKHRGVMPREAEECRKCLTESLKEYNEGRKQMPENTKSLTLLDVAGGDRCVVKGIRKKGLVTKRLVEMGISRGSVIEVERVAPLGDPVEIKVKGYHLSIRKDEAASIEVEKQ